MVNGCSSESELDDLPIPRCGPALAVQLVVESYGRFFCMCLLQYAPFSFATARDRSLSIPVSFLSKVSISFTAPSPAPSSPSRSSLASPPSDYASSHSPAAV